MREHVIQVWCDQHAATSDEGAAPVRASHQLTMGLDTDGPLRLDLCGDCWDLLVAPLAKTLADYGAKPDAPAGPVKKGSAAPRSAAPPSAMQSDPGTCPLCGTHAEWLSSHLQNRHGIKAPADSVCPLCGEQGAGATGLGRHFLDAHGQRLKWWLAEQQAAKPKRPQRARKSGT